MTEAFDSYRQRACQRIAEIALAWARDALDEQAVPAYTRGNALSRRLFWKRLAIVAKALPADGGGTCLDFGCGSGVMLPLLQRRFDRVVGVDIMPDFARTFVQRMNDPRRPPRAAASIHGSLDDAGLAAGSVDVILALDVLEHVDNLDEWVRRLAGLLKPGGRLIVSGPTENLLYRLGRRVVGFSGHYHHRNVYDIEASMKQCVEVRRTGSIPWFCPLFLLLCGRRK
jgi:2-polyprenyl-3-methyl-5-hydroxy-6-metoxy-1,4-benzoquinol methylase